MNTRLFLVALSLFTVMACSNQSAPPTTNTVPVEGFVHAGPTCPVLRDPPDPDCADRPVSGAELHIRDASGELVSTVTTSEDGTFVALLPPGTYTLEPQPVDGLTGTAAPHTFAVGTRIVELDVAYDTGIR